MIIAGAFLAALVGTAVVVYAVMRAIKLTEDNAHGRFIRDRRIDDLEVALEELAAQGAHQAQGIEDATVAAETAKELVARLRNDLTTLKQRVR